MIAIIDYKLGNPGSVFNMLKYLGYESEITFNRERILMADRLILPGVGSFDAGIQNLRKLELVEVLNEKVLNDKTPVLGICLGMQLMGSSSEEGQESGLEWISGRSVRFDPEKVRVPHITWNEITIRSGVGLFKDLDSNLKFYFAHSFHFEPEDEELVIAKASYGNSFVGGVEKGKILGVQFHPEKSHKFGMKLLKNFISEY